jgi:2-polyprenyl-6-hydroxyphenyl methylase/3-demethylubiquinone-9 3-methyltransferase
LTRRRYPEDHWTRRPDADQVLAAYLDQQALAYSRVKFDFIQELLGEMNGRRFLDFGCGGGLYTAEAAVRGAALSVGLDAEPTLSAAARELARRRGVADRCRFVTADTPAALDFGAGFDAVLIKDVIEHVADDRDLLETIAGLLTPGGRLVVCTQNAWSLNYLTQGLWHRVLRRERDWCGWDPTHLRFYTPRSLARLLRQAGFRPVAWRSAYLVPQKIEVGAGPSRRLIRLDGLVRLDRLLGRSFPFHRLGWSLSVLASRR